MYCIIFCMLFFWNFSFFVIDRYCFFVIFVIMFIGFCEEIKIFRNVIVVNCSI